MPLERDSAVVETDAERRRWKTEVLSASPSDLGGFKEVVLEVRGKGAYSRLKHESGVHRVQRVPATEAQGRIHTSAATVAVLPEGSRQNLSDPYAERSNAGWWILAILALGLVWAVSSGHLAPDGVHLVVPEATPEAAPIAPPTN